MNPVNIVVVTLSIILMASVSVMADVRPSRPLTANTCEGSTLNIKCDNGRIDVISANYGRTSKTECNSGGNAPIRTLNCASNNSFDIVKSKCENHQSCSIQANNGVFGDPCVGTYKYLRVEYRCIEEPTRPLTANTCEGSTLNIKCDNGRIDVKSANYGRTSKTECNSDGNAPIRTLNCVSNNSFDIVKSKCENHQSCSIQANNGVFGDPCVGTFKYLQVEYRCIEEPTKPSVYKKVACEGSNLHIECGRTEEIVILRANYGRTSRRVCNVNNRLSPNHSSRCVCGNSKRIVNNECSNKRKCTISASNNVFGDPCVGTDKYLVVEYICIAAGGRRRN